MVVEAQRTLPLGVTIAIVDWRRAGLLRAVASALAGVRALADWAIPGEALVVGDRSDDDQVILLQQLEALYYGEGLRFFLHEERAAPGAARHLALALATYRYVFYLDGNEALVANALPLFYRAMGDTHAALVCGNVIMHHPDGAFSMINEIGLGCLPQEPNYPDWCALWDRLQLDDTGSLDAGQALPDAAEQISRLAASGRRLVFVPAIFGHHYHDPGAKTTADAPGNSGDPLHPEHVCDQADQQEQNDPKRHFLRYHPDLGYL